ncbi:hypothetical protein ILYODFUR_037372 [Ilyodon furcidens]|uniref:Uncharacterized protein n=1 Tax=Ilyodon furcidens TaxID=33524 RepID=A0ABV0TQE6_9TELE
MLVAQVSTQTPPPLLLESRVLFWCCAVRPASSIAESKMDECSQVSVSSRMQLALPVLFVATCSLSLLAGDLGSANKRLESGGLCGCFHSLASTPALWPHFCFCLLPPGKVIHGDPVTPSYVHRDLVCVNKLSCNTPFKTNSCFKQI